MKKRIVIALIATLTLTLGSFGTVFAMNSNPVIELQTNETLKQGDQPENPDGGETTNPEEPDHTHTWGDPYYVIDQEAKYEKVEVIDQEEKWDWVTVIDVPAWTENITERHEFCNVCGLDLTEAAKAAGMDFYDYFYEVHVMETMHGGYHDDDAIVGTIEHPAETHEEWQKVQDKVSHFEDKLISPEKGHWEHTCADCGEIQNSETGEVIKPGTLPEEPTDSSEPTDPEVKPGDDTETPGEDTQKPTDETEKPDQDAITETTDNSDKQDQQNDDKTTTPESADKNEKSNTATTTVSNEDKAPQTGDTASLIYLATLAGSAVTGGTAFGLRKKFKK